MNKFDKKYNKDDQKRRKKNQLSFIKQQKKSRKHETISDMIPKQQKGL